MLVAHSERPNVRVPFGRPEHSGWVCPDWTPLLLFRWSIVDWRALWAVRAIPLCQIQWLNQ